MTFVSQGETTRPSWAPQMIPLLDEVAGASPSRFGLAPIGAERLSEFLIDGESLLGRIEREEGFFDVRPAIGALVGVVSRLLLESPPELPGGRVALYVCRRCSQGSCSSISARIRAVDRSTIEWGEIGFSDSPSLEPSRPFTGLGRLVFARNHYEAALLRHRHNR